MVVVEVVDVVLVDVVEVVDVVLVVDVLDDVVVAPEQPQFVSLLKHVLGGVKHVKQVPSADRHCVQPVELQVGTVVVVVVAAQSGSKPHAQPTSHMPSPLQLQ